MIANTDNFRNKPEDLERAAPWLSSLEYGILSLHCILPLHKAVAVSAEIEGIPFNHGSTIGVWFLQTIV